VVLNTNIIFIIKSNTPPLHRGINSKVGQFLVNRLLPSGSVQSVGAIVFLDHVYPVNLEHEHSPMPSGDFAHPHRGIATFSYVLSGSLSHYDSRGNHGILNTGGLQWMKAGNGIIHDEKPFTAEKDGPIFHSLQFWVNLPGANKKDDPEYIALQAADVPEVQLPDHGGSIRILLGELGSLASPVPTFNNEFIYHLSLNPNSRFSFLPRKGYEAAVFVPAAEVVIKDTLVGNSKMLLLRNDGQEIVFHNDQIKAADIFIFGGVPYREPIVAEGPFVMNSHADIAMAYRDFFAGVYGTIDYRSI
jgi:redox-sensitive bicupin YhaK (pirin superfamily)